MESQKESKSVAQLVNDLAAAMIVSDICLSCSATLGEDQKLILLKLPTQRGDKIYPYVAITCCAACAQAQDYNRTKKTLSYWLQEGKLDVIA